MADPVLKFPPEQKGQPGAAPPTKLAAEPRRRLMAGMRRYRRFLLLVVLPLVALVAGLTLLSQRRPLRDHRRRLCRRAEGADHARHLRQDREGRGQGRPAGQARRRAVRDRSGAVPARGGSRPRPSSTDAKTTYDNLVANIKIYGQMLDLAQQGIELKQRDVERKSSLVKNNVGSQLDLDNASNALVTARRAGAIHQAAAFQRQDATARQSRTAARAIPALCPGQGRARRGPAQSRPHRDARADGRRRDPGRPDPARPLRHRRHAGVLHHRRRRTPGSTPIRRNPISPMSRSASPSPSTSTPSRTTCSRARSARSRPAPARNSRSCRRRTPPAISSRWCSASRCGSISTRTTSSSRKLKAGMSVYATIDTNHRRSLAGLLGFAPAAANQDRTESMTTSAVSPLPFPACAGTW